MEFKSHWVFDDFYPEVQPMRDKIDEHFTESTARHLPFSQRGIWNYWYIPKMYTYLRAEPWVLLPPDMFEAFMRHLRQFAAREFGLVIPTKPYLSMYVDGCGQNVHNDFNNGRMAYVFSLTKWAERHFEGGETHIYFVGDTSRKRFLHETGGWGWYDLVEPHFNRIAFFDDRMPHSVNFIHGTMDPLDARFALHGHLQEPAEVPYIEGGLKGFDLNSTFLPLRKTVSDLLQSRGLDGFVTINLTLDAWGKPMQVDITHMQLVTIEPSSKQLEPALVQLREIIAKSIWPMAEAPSKMVFALGAGRIKSDTHPRVVWPFN